MRRWFALGFLVLIFVLPIEEFGGFLFADDTEAFVEAMESTAETEAAAPTEMEQLNYSINTLIMFICAVLVLFMQAGFALVESGLNSQKNTVNIMFKNIMDLSIGVMLFWAFGFNMMYPGDHAGWLPKFPTGSNSFMVARDSDPDIELGYSHSADFLFQVAFAATAATIVSGAVAGRLKFSGYLIYSAIITGVIYPISGYWKWGAGPLDVWGFQDFAGSIVVHAVGGFAGLAGAIVLGPRIGRFTADGKSRPIPGHNLAMACLGVFILFIGWFGFNPGSNLAYTGISDAEATSYIALTTILAAVAGSIAAMALGWGLFGKPDLTMAMNGLLAGLVGITANCDRVSQTSAVIIGGVAGLLVVAGILLLEKLRIDDPVGAFPVHGLCGVWGGIATGIFGDLPEGIATRAGFIQVQVISTVIICVWAFATMLAVFLGLKAVQMLRVSAEEELRGLDIGEHGMEAYVTT